MQLKPIKCPNCAASIKLDRLDELVSCHHCDSSFFVEWPDDGEPDEKNPAPPRRHFYIVLGANPFASCPFCSTQALRTPANANRELVCRGCQQTATMPPLMTHAARVCRECGRAHFEVRCPDCARDKREMYGVNINF